MSAWTSLVPTKDGAVLEIRGTNGVLASVNLRANELFNIAHQMQNHGHAAVSRQIIERLEPDALPTIERR